MTILGVAAGSRELQPGQKSNKEVKIVIDGAPGKKEQDLV